MDRIAGAPPLNDYSVGQRVMTKEGFPGVVAEVLDGPEDLLTYIVTLDNAMGGGEYAEGEIWPESGRSAAQAVADHTAADDYPELGTVLTDRLPPQITTHAGAAWTHADDDDYDDDLNYPMYYHPPVPSITEEEVKEAARRISLTLPLDPTDNPDKAARSPREQEGYESGMVDGKAGVTHNFRGNYDPEWRAGYDAGWSFGVQMTRAPIIDDVQMEKQLEDEQIVSVDPVLGIRQDETQFLSTEAGLWDVIKGNTDAYKGYLTYDWCRYRRDGRCFYSKTLNVEASEQMGYAVWVPEDRGSCWRGKWTAQQACPMGQPGPNVEGGFTNATVPFEEGGQRGGAPTDVYRQSMVTASLDPALAFHLISSWRDVQAKAKRIRSEGGVRVVASHNGVVVGHIRGDTNVYETELVAMPGRQSVASWNCGCKWSAYSWGRSGPWKKYEGRMCSHALALSYEIQSRGMFGQDLTLDQTQPAWMDTSIPVRTPNSYDRDKGRYSSRGEYAAAVMRPVYEQDEDDKPIVTFVAALLSEGVRYADIKVFAQNAGVDNVPALVKEARKVAPFLARVWDRIVSLFIEDGKVMEVGTKKVVAPKDVLFPDYDPKKGLAFDPRVASVEHTAKEWRPTITPDKYVDGPTFEEAADEMIRYAKAVEDKTTPLFDGLAKRYGGLLEGLRNRFKTKESLLRKMRAEAAGRDPAVVALSMSDALRYTMLFPPERYTEGTKKVLDALAGAGYGERTKNYWARGDSYNGINVALTSPEKFPVELQFHTAESIHAKLNGVHQIYDVWRKSEDPWERMALGRKMQLMYDKVPQPPHVMDIAPHKSQQVIPQELFGIMAAVQSGFRYLLLDNGQLLRLSNDHSSVDLWTGIGWEHAPEHGRYEYLGETTFEDVTEGEVEELIHRATGISPTAAIPDPVNPFERSIYHADQDELDRQYDEMDAHIDEADRALWETIFRSTQDALEERGDPVRPPTRMDRVKQFFTGDLHDEPEPALPTTDGADDEADLGVSGVGPQVEEARDGLPLLDAALETPAPAGEADRAHEIVARFDEWNQIVAQGGVPDFPHPFEHLGGGQPSSADPEVMAAAQAFAEKTALRTYTAEERKAFIEEGSDSEETASNFDKMDISGTHYEALEAAQAKAAAHDVDDMWMLDGDPNG